METMHVRILTQSRPVDAGANYIVQLSGVNIASRHQGCD